MEKMDNNDYFLGKMPHEDTVEVFKQTLGIQNTYKVITETENDLYRDTIKEYRRFISKCAKLIVELNLPNDELLIALVIQRLIYNDAFSLDTLVETADITHELKSQNGASIIYGEACCRNLSDFINIVLKRLDINRPQIYCTITENRINRRRRANHVTNLVNHNGTLQIFDPIHDNIAGFLNGTDARGIAMPTHKYNIKLADYMVYEGYTIEQIHDLVESFRLASTLNQITIDEYLKLIEQAENSIVDNSSLILDFIEDTHSMKEKIASGIPVVETRKKK